MTGETKVTKAAVAGINTFACDCKGTVFVPVSMAMLARLKVHGAEELTGTCTRGHPVKIRLRGGILLSSEDE
jgi:hypothetical protein